MRVLRNHLPHHSRIAIVCCLHGDERYGLTVFEHFEKNIDLYPSMTLILANEPAIEQNVRYISQDLNRSFPGVTAAPDEIGLAYDILEMIHDADIVLDIHTTTSELSLLPIITKYSDLTSRIINATEANEVAFIAPALGAHAMITHVKGGLSLEYGERYAQRPETLSETIAIVDRIMSDTAQAPRRRTIFHVTDVLPLTTPIPPEAQNFQIIPELGIYPILLHEKAYTNLHALAATSYEVRTV